LIPKVIKTRVGQGIPVIVLDLNTKQSYEFVSIAEAARFFNIYPKAI
jgi:hypothetical protein